MRNNFPEFLSAGFIIKLQCCPDAGLFVLLLFFFSSFLFFFLSFLSSVVVVVVLGGCLCCFRLQGLVESRTSKLVSFSVCDRTTDLLLKFNSKLKIDLFTTERDKRFSLTVAGRLRDDSS